MWDTTFILPAPLPPSPAYTRTSGPVSSWALHPTLPDAPLVAATSYPDCGRPWPHSVLVDPPASPTVHFARLFCTSPHKAPPFCTRDIASRTVATTDGLQLPGAVSVSAIPWATPCAPLPDPLLRPTPPSSHDPGLHTAWLRSPWYTLEDQISF